MTNKEAIEEIKKWIEGCPIKYTAQAFDLAIKALERYGTLEVCSCPEARHGLKYYKEEDNICDMEQLATVEFYKSEKTGKIYAEFILEDGCWMRTKEIYPNEFTNLTEALLSFAEGEKGDVI